MLRVCGQVHVNAVMLTTAQSHRRMYYYYIQDLLICGQPTAELEHFLLQELTEKGLKKLQDSTDNSYLNIQRLVLKYLHAVAQVSSCDLSTSAMLGRSANKFIPPLNN